MSVAVRPAALDGNPFAYCEQLTRREARNFWYGIRLLPPAKRGALAAVYALCRRIDDVGDGTAPADEKRAALDDIERGLAAISPSAGDPVLAALGAAARRFPLPLEAFGDLVAGVRMDVDGAAYETFGDLVVYCRRVAGSVGRLSLGVFGATSPEDEGLADDLGVAMQLTNILRDVREDLGNGRVYLPASDLARYGLDAGALAGPATPEVGALVRYEAVQARMWFDRGLRLLGHLDHRSAACAGAMAGIYLRLLARISAEPERVVERRPSVPAGEKALTAALVLVRRPR